MRSEEAVGEIHECPKCGSMVQVVPPEGWQPEPQVARQSADADASAAEGVEHAGPQSGSEVAAGVEAELSGPPVLGVSPIELAWRKWLLLGAAPAAGLVIVIGVCSIFFWRDRPQPQPSTAIGQPAEPAPRKRPRCSSVFVRRDWPGSRTGAR